MVAVFVFFIPTEAPGSGLPFSSVTLPDIFLSWAKVLVIDDRHASIANKLMDSLLSISGLFG
ncbi:hypothetical protein D3C87_1284040 [compost metagenome]